MQNNKGEEARPFLSVKYIHTVPLEKRTSKSQVSRGITITAGEERVL